MYLVEPTPLSTARLPIPGLRAHLRLGTGFTDDTAQDALLEQVLRASLAEVERLCAKAVLIRDFVWTTHAWRDPGRQVLPRGPLVSVEGLTITDIDGSAQAIAPDAYRVARDAQRPALVARGFVLPQIPVGGSAAVTFRAGFADDWNDAPSDLALAVLSLAAARYEDRAAEGTVPPGVQALLAPHRPHRLLGGM